MLYAQIPPHLVVKTILTTLDEAEQRHYTSRAVSSRWLKL